MTKFAKVNLDLQNKSNQSMNFPLPGGKGQLNHLIEQNIPKGNHVLIIGTVSDSIIKKLLEHFTDINIISDNYDSLISLKMNLKAKDSIKIKMMDYAHTDFNDKHFDLIYAQASISVLGRKNILKEVKRILSDVGLLSVGEIVSIKEPVAGFIKDIWERSGLEPVASSAIKKFYESKGFEVISEKDLSDTLSDFYEKIRFVVSKAGKNEKEQDKKYFSQMKHESHAYLKLGGDKYIGLKSLIMRKSN
jgi:ubiquinone/menaquinone biosynthesis C-methylase UbiE